MVSSSGSGGGAGGSVFITINDTLLGRGQISVNGGSGVNGGIFMILL